MEYGLMLLRMIAVLGGVCLLAVLILKYGVSRLGPSGAGANARLRVLEQLSLGSRRRLLVVRAGEQILLVGSSEAGLTSLGELEPHGWCAADEEDEEAHVSERC